MTGEAKPQRADVLKKLREILDLETEDPSTTLIATGKALVSIGEALKGQSLADQRAIVAAAVALEGKR